MRTTDVPRRLAMGVAAGMAGSMVLQGLRTASERLRPETLPSMREDPGEFMVRKAEERLPAGVRQRVPELAETAAARSLALGYGITAGALYGVLRPRPGSALTDGALLGAAVWAAGYMGWLPALGLTPPVREERAEATATTLLRHVAFGVAVVGAYRGLRGMA